MRSALDEDRDGENQQDAGFEGEEDSEESRPDVDSATADEPHDRDRDECEYGPGDVDAEHPRDGVVRLNGEEAVHADLECVV